MAITAFDFEKPIVDLEHKIENLESKKRKDQKIKGELERLKDELNALRNKIYGNLTPYQRVLFARHLGRPHAGDYIRQLTTNFIEIHGDRGYGDDKAVICGMAEFDDQPCVVIGQQKGRDTKENIKHNFGMMHPEGYRKALRVMKLADKFRLPILIFIDTPGAYPGVGAEERGQFEAIARNIREMFTLRAPVIVSIIGEGASGGALGIGVGDAVLMLENSWYSVISPEGCASILWRDASFAPQAAEALKLTARDLKELSVIDEIVPEPLGGAHRDPETVYQNLKAAIQKHLQRLSQLDERQILEHRFNKYRGLGQWLEAKS